MESFESQFNVVIPKDPESKRRKRGEQDVDSTEEEEKNPEIRNPITETEKTISFLGVELEKGKGGAHVPDNSQFEGDVITEYDLRLMRDIAIALKLNQPVMIEGGSGLGKTHTVDHICAYTKREAYYANCRDMDADILVGTLSSSEETKSGFGWRDGIVLQAIRSGGILFLDEYNFMKGETRARLHEILDVILQGKKSITLIENFGEVVSVHPDFRVVASQNAPGKEYGDREVLDPAQYTRFAHIKLPDEMPKDLKKARFLGYFGKDNVISLDRDEYYVEGGASRQILSEVPNIDLLIEKYIEFTEAIEQIVKSRKLGAGQPQPVYFSPQRDFNRVMEFVQTFYRGDINEVFQRALRYYYANKFETAKDRKKVKEMITNVRAEASTDSRRRPSTRTKPGGKPAAKDDKKDAEARADAEADPTEELLKTADTEIASLKKAVREAKRELSGETFEPVLSVDYAYTGEKKKKITEHIELNFDAKVISWQSFYESEGVSLPGDFAEAMRDIWSRNYDAIKTEIEKFGFDEVLFVPGGLTVTDLHTKMSEGYNPTFEGSNFKEGGSFAGVKEVTKEPRILLVHKKVAQNLKDHHLLKDTLGKKAETLIAEGEKLTLTDYLIYQRGYFKETGKHLDEIGWTLLPGSHSGARVVHAGWDPAGGQLRVSALDPGYSHGSLGCRLSRSFL